MPGSALAVAPLPGVGHPIVTPLGRGTSPAHAHRSIPPPAPLLHRPNETVSGVDDPRGNPMTEVVEHGQPAGTWRRRQHRGASMSTTRGPTGWWAVGVSGSHGLTSLSAVRPRGANHGGIVPSSVALEQSLEMARFQPPDRAVRDCVQRAPEARSGRPATRGRTPQVIPEVRPLRFVRFRPGPDRAVKPMPRDPAAEVGQEPNHSGTARRSTLSPSDSDSRWSVFLSSSGWTREHVVGSDRSGKLVRLPRRRRARSAHVPSYR